MKNLKIYASSLIVTMGLSLMGCSGENVENLGNSYMEAIFYEKYGYSFEQFLKEKEIVELKFCCFEPLTYYEAKMSSPVYENGNFSFKDYWKKIDNFEEFFGIARKVDVYYKFIAIDFNDDKPIITELVTNDLVNVSDEYKYVYKDDYIVLEKSDSFYVNNGKIIERVR